MQVSDGIIAGGFEPAALEILRAKKGGKYIVLQADEAFEPPLKEERVVFGTTFTQSRAAEAVSAATLVSAPLASARNEAWVRTPVLEYKMSFVGGHPLVLMSTQPLRTLASLLDTASVHGITCSQR